MTGDVTQTAAQPASTAPAPPASGTGDRMPSTPEVHSLKIDSFMASQIATDSNALFRNIVISQSNLLLFLQSGID